MKLQNTIGGALAALLSFSAVANIAMPEPETSGPAVVEEVTLRPVFGQNLFDGFRQAEFKGFNPDYKIAIGDTVTLQMWGAYEVAVELTVDAQGNVFIPQVGPVLLQGVANKRLEPCGRKKSSKCLSK